MPWKIIAQALSGLILLLAPFGASGQLTAPDRRWAAPTAYALTSEQDSIVAYHKGDTILLCAALPNKANAQFTWLRFANSHFADTLQRSSTTTADTLRLSATALSEGGYRVLADNLLNDTAIHTIWVFVDDVKIDTLLIDNECDFMRIEPRTIPNRYDLDYDRFTYWDISRTTPIPINTYGRSYFNQMTWECSEPEIELPSKPKPDLLIQSPAPLLNAQYTISVTSPFGRTLTAKTNIVEATAVKAEQEIMVMKQGAWSTFSESDKHEALLELALKSTATNADSACWCIRKQNPNNGRYTEIWSTCIAFGSAEVLPDKTLMVPGHYRIVHTAKNATSHCIDSISIDLQVDSSMIKEEAIPNVFTPTNADGNNDVFRFIDPEQNIRSMQSCLIRIYNRSGKLMHSYNGDPRQWTGWDGKTHGRMANPGIYYYIIESKGWDGQEFKRGPYKGFFYLY